MLLLRSASDSEFGAWCEVSGFNFLSVRLEFPYSRCLGPSAGPNVAILDLAPAMRLSSTLAIAAQLGKNVKIGSTTRQ